MKGLADSAEDDERVKQNQTDAVAPPFHIQQKKRDADDKPE